MRINQPAIASHLGAPEGVAAGLLVCERAGLYVRHLEARDGAPSGVLVAPEALLHTLLEQGL